MAERGSSLYEPRCLAPLVEKCELLSLTPTGKVRAKEKLPQILNEHGIPERMAMIQTALATIASRHCWTGSYDVHHLAYPGAIYRGIIAYDGERIGSNYRGAPMLKAWLPRQLHVFMHEIYEAPPVPSEEVMRHFGREAMIVSNLFNAIRVDSYKAFPKLNRLPFEQQEINRQLCLQSRLENLPESEFGIIPDREYLAKLELAEVRKIIRAIARVQGFSNRGERHALFIEPLGHETSAQAA